MLGMWPHLWGRGHFGRGELDVLWLDTLIMAGGFHLIGDSALDENWKERLQMFWSALSMYVYDLDGTAARLIMASGIGLKTLNPATAGENGQGLILNALHNSTHYLNEMDLENNPSMYYLSEMEGNGEF